MNSVRMKTHPVRLCIICVLFFSPFFSLSAQRVNEIHSFYVHPISGTGLNDFDNTYLEYLLDREVRSWNYFLRETPEEADYDISGSVGMYLSEIDGGFYTGEYYLHLVLHDNRAGEIMVEQLQLYDSMESLLEIYGDMVGNIFRNIPATPGEPDIIMMTDDAWRNNWLYVSAYGSWTPRLFETTTAAGGASVHFAGFGGGLMAEFHFLNFLSLETGVEIASDRIRVTTNDEYASWMLEIPVLLKFIFKPGNTHLMMDAFGGAQFNFALHKQVTTPLLALTGGIHLGIQAKDGAIIIGGRFSRDYGNAEIVTSSQTNPLTVPFQRSMLHFSIGYKYGFFPRKQ